MSLIGGYAPMRVRFGSSEILTKSGIVNQSPEISHSPGQKWRRYGFSVTSVLLS